MRSLGSSGISSNSQLRVPAFYVLEQGVYATNTPFIPRPPQIQLGMCGTPLLRLESSIDPNAQEGDTCGFFLWTDLKGYNGSVLYAYSQLTDPLIEEGWSVLVEDQEDEENHGDNEEDGDFFRVREYQLARNRMQYREFDLLAERLIRVVDGFGVKYELTVN